MRDTIHSVLENAVLQEQLGGLYALYGLLSSSTNLSCECDRYSKCSIQDNFRVHCNYSKSFTVTFYVLLVKPPLMIYNHVGI